MGNVSKNFLEQQKKERLYSTNYNKNGELIKVVDYIDSHHVIVEFQDEYKKQKIVTWNEFVAGGIRNPKDKERLYIIKTNNQGCAMKVVKYNHARDIVVEFQDEYKAQVHTTWHCFQHGSVRNPYYANVYNVGIVGEKYLTSVNGSLIKEYRTWTTMLRRCYDEEYRKLSPTYNDVTCCKEWLLYENFYEWLHSQANFDRWVLEKRSALDKDILFKGNKVYSPDTCCLVPYNVNSLFVKRDSKRGSLPIGVVFYKPLNKYKVQCDDNIGNGVHLGYYDTIEEGFQTYKKYKENLIKEVASEEYLTGNISQHCYEAMMNYEVEITD